MDTADRSPALLNAGVWAGIIFFIVATAESFLRPGFDLSRHAISMLSLGERGWLMVATFVLSGVLVLACAVGLKREGAGVTVPALLGLYGIGLVLAGLFPAPAGLGFPPGTPDDQQPVMTTTAIVHSIAFMLAFSSLIVACFVMAFRSRRTNGTLALVSAATGIALPLLIALGMAQVVATGVAFYLAAMLAWLWLAIVCTAAMRGRV